MKQKPLPERLIGKGRTIADGFETGITPVVFVVP